MSLVERKEREEIRNTKQEVRDLLLALQAEADVLTAVTRAHMIRVWTPHYEYLYNMSSEWECVQLDKPMTLYKVVAANDKGRLVSVYDGRTTYTLGKLTQAARGALAYPTLDSMLYGYDSLRDALALKFPKSSKMRGAPMIAIEVEASGRAYRRKGTGAWAVERMRTLKFASEMMIRVQQT